MTDNAASDFARKALGYARVARRTALGGAVFRLALSVPFLRGLADRIRSGSENSPRNLQAISGLSLPRNDAFFSARTEAHGIEGMFSDFSMAVIDSLLSVQKTYRVTGSILEFGVYKGRSAALMGRQLAPSERLVLVDIADYLDRKAIAPFRDATDFILARTEDFKTAYSAYHRQLRSFRFIHIDASHAYRATFSELKMADALLADKGIVAMDDFTNLNYSQNVAAIFKYIYTTRTDLRIFLVTEEKAYLCRKKDVEFYATFVLDRLIAEMGSRDIGDCCLARTDTDPEYSAFFARRRSKGEEGSFYGVDIYRNFLMHP